MTDIGGKWLNLSKRTAYICLAQIATEQLAIAGETKKCSQKSELGKY